MIVAIKARREDWLEERVGSSSNAQNEKLWATLWKVSVPANIKVFLWRLSKNSLPMEDVRKHRRMSTHDHCFACGAPDSWKRSLVECARARCVWALVDHDLLEHMIETNEGDAKSWLFSMMDVLSHADFTTMSVALWAIWYSRRKLIHEGEDQSPYDTHRFVLRFISELEQLSVPTEPTTAARSTCNQEQ